MAIYLLYVMSPVIVWILMNIINTESINYDDRRKKNYIIICGIIMALMIGLRYKGVGSGDTAFYYSNWRMNITKSRFGVWISNNCMVFITSFFGWTMVVDFLGRVFFTLGMFVYLSQQ